MKKITIFTLFFFLTLFSFSEKKVWKDPNAKPLFPTDENGKIVFTEVVEVPNVLKDALYSRAYEWFAKSFKSAQNVIQMEDKENGKIVGKGAFGDINVTANLGLVAIKGKVLFTISVYVKDGKYKFELTDLTHEAKGYWSNGIKPADGGALENEKPACGRNTLPLGKWKDIKEETSKRTLTLIETLKQAMTIDSAGNDW